MTLPEVTQTITDNALGIAQANATGTQVKLGISSAGTVNTLYSFTDPQLLKATLGHGPLVEAAAHTLQVAGGPVLCMRVTGSVAGTLSAVALSGTGTGTVTATGVPLDTYDALVEITREGANIAAGTGAFKYSLDGGDVYSAEIAIPTGGVYVVPDSGVTLTFVNGVSGTSFIAGDVHTFTSVAPGYSANDLNAAFTVLLADPTTWAFAHIVGAAATASASATIASAVATQMTAAQALYRYVFAIVECADGSDATLKAAFLNFTSARVMVAAGYCELTSAVSGRTYKRHAAWPIATRLSQQDVRRDAARVRSDSEGGALEGVVRLYRDEYVTQALDEARFATLRTYPGKPGFFITNGRMMASLTSDYQYVQFRRIMDLACRVNYLAMLDYLNDDAYRVNPVTGFINEVDARTIEGAVESTLRAELTDKDRVTSVSVRIARDVNLLSTLTLNETLRVVPRGYAKFIEVDIGFLNPSLQPKAP